MVLGYPLPRIIIYCLEPPGRVELANPSVRSQRPVSDSGGKILLGTALLPRPAYPQSGVEPCLAVANNILFRKQGQPRPITHRLTRGTRE